MTHRRQHVRSHQHVSGENWKFDVQNLIQFFVRECRHLWIARDIPEAGDRRYDLSAEHGAIEVEGLFGVAHEVQISIDPAHIPPFSTFAPYSKFLVVTRIIE